MAHDVFISYSTKDKLIADAVCASLEAAKIRCWITPRDILPGQDWAESIESAITKSKLMILIFSSYSNNSKQVAREVALAFNSEVTVIPFRIENIEPKGAMKYYLLNTHWQDALTPPIEDHIKKLVRIASSLIFSSKFIEEDHPEVTEKKVVDKPKVSRRKLMSKSTTVKVLIGLAIVISLAVSISLLINYYNKDKNKATSEATTVQTTAAEITTTTTAAEQLWLR